MIRYAMNRGKFEGGRNAHFSTTAEHREGNNPFGEMARSRKLEAEGIGELQSHRFIDGTTENCQKDERTCLGAAG
jgi:hypothetical protein